MNRENMIAAYRNVIMEVVRDQDRWTHFLDTAAYMYKYHFADQVMIYGQRQDAIMCASFELWNKLGCWIKGGARGIAIFDANNKGDKIKYIFDVKDVNLKKKAPPKLWKLTRGNVETVTATLLDEEDIVPDGEKPVFRKSVRAVVHSVVDENYSSYYDQLRECIERSDLTDLSEQDLQWNFIVLLKDSVEYMIMKRCGAKGVQLGFRGIELFNSPRTINVLGCATADLSKEILRRIERTVKDYERSGRDAKSDVHRGRGRDSLSRPRDGRTAGEPNQVRVAADEVPERTQERPVHIIADRGDATETLPGDSGAGGEPQGQDSGATQEGESTAQDGGLPDSGAVEPPDRPAGGRNRDERDHLQHGSIGQAEQLPEPVDAESAGSSFLGEVTQEDIDSVLLGGSHYAGGKFRIYQQYVEKHTNAENIKFLKEEYGIGGGTRYFPDGARGYEDHDSKGIKISKDNVEEPLQLSWAKVNARVKTLISEGKYLSQEQIDLIPQYNEWRQLRTQAANAEQGLRYERNRLFNDALKNRSFNLSVGTTVNVDGSDHQILEIGEDTITLTDPEYPLLQKIKNKAEMLEDMATNERWRNQHLLVIAEPTTVVPDIPSFETWVKGRQEQTELPASPDSEKQHQLEPNTGEVELPTVESFGKIIDFKPRESDGPLDISEPILRIVFSEHPAFEDGAEYPYNIANALVKEIDSLARDVRDKVIADGERPAWRYFKTRYEVVWKINGEEFTYNIRQDLGDGRGGVTEYILSNATKMLETPELREEIGERGVEAFEVTRYALVPYLQQYEHLTTKEQMEVQNLLFEHRENMREQIGTAQYNDSDFVEITEEEFKRLAGGSHDELVNPLIQGIEDGSITIDKDGNTITFKDANSDGHYVDLDVELTDENAEWLESQPDGRLEQETNVDAEKENTIKPILTKQKRDDGLTDLIIDMMPASQMLEKEPEPERHNFRITDDDYGVAGAKTRFQKNVAAIRLLKTIEGEERLATPDEQSMLSGYTGWGAIPQAFDKSNGSWANEYAELKALLTEDEHTAAEGTTVNGHYTSPVVIRAMYAGLEKLGFRKGNVIDPACGSGNFYGNLPDSMGGSRLYGVEIDSITSRIARQLYQNVRITTGGYEDTQFDDNFFDVAVGNVPFGTYKVADARYNKYNFLIHDYFFAKSIDKVRPGGLIAFVTSKGTMDKANPQLRKYIAQRAKLIGAIRLPNTAFKANAGTEVTADIVFLQKRDRAIETEPYWVHITKNDDGVPINQYFADHPEMILGRFEFVSSMYGNDKDTACLPYEDRELSELLEFAVGNLEGEYTEQDIDEELDEEAGDGSIPADPEVKNFTYTIHEGEIYYRENALMYKAEMNETAKERVRGLISIRQIVRAIIDAQMMNRSDEDIRLMQGTLNTRYDTFAKKHGIINGHGNKRAFKLDADYPLLCSLELLDEENNFDGKTAFFTKRTVRPHHQIEKVDTADEALIVSMAERGRVDMEFMSDLTGKQPKQIVWDLTGLIFKDPMSDVEDISAGWMPKDEYLSGNVREKLKLAQMKAENHETFKVNVAALAEVIPEDIEAADIDVRLGSVWVPPEDIEDFIIQTLEPPEHSVRRMSVQYSPYSSMWSIRNTPYTHGNVLAI